MSRRSVLKGAAGAGTAGLALTLAGMPAALAGGQPASRKPAGSAAAGTGTAGETEASAAVVVHVRDVRTGEMDVYRGTSHVRVTDRNLASRLARASRQPGA